MDDFDALLAAHPELGDLAAAATDGDAEADPRRAAAPPPGLPVFAGQMIRTAPIRIDLARYFLRPGQLEELHGQIGMPVCVHNGPRHVIGILLAIELSDDGSAIRLSINEFIRGNPC